jgi:spore maturation protein SpmB
MYVMFTYVCFWYGIPLKRIGANNRFCEGSREGIKISAVSMKPQVSMTPLDELQ